MLDTRQVNWWNLTRRGVHQSPILWNGYIRWTETMLIRIWREIKRVNHDWLVESDGD